ncbi:cysteine proteinase [Atractiella rhizophila]|nr:cysteine proteinase [Atractiella rhizophila]KAH8915202.1 cysteine proteinase [Atractiella rhizophila]KAH8917442.1 cysteine proteinase [Atractiella rhizophila]
MGKTYRSQPGGGGKKARPVPRVKSRRNRPDLITEDPESYDRGLKAQLKSMGLYAAHTMGDGNCLFRALSDQLFGTPNAHLQLRKETVEFVRSHREQYLAFVDEDVWGNWDGYLRGMSTSGTYGGHLELSAFAKLKRRRIKVVQPGLVYVVGWKDESPSASNDAASASPSGTSSSTVMLSRKERRSRLKRELEREMDAERGGAVDQDNEEEEGEPLYIAYHNWEHYSSVRNISGPHQGLPKIRDTTPPSSDPSSSSPLPVPSPPNDDPIDSEETEEEAPPLLNLNVIPPSSSSPAKALLRSPTSVAHLLNGQNHERDSSPAISSESGSSKLTGSSLGTSVVSSEEWEKEKGHSNASTIVGLRGRGLRLLDTGRRRRMETESVSGASSVIGRRSRSRSPSIGEESPRQRSRRESPAPTTVPTTTAPTPAPGESDLSEPDDTALQPSTQETLPPSPPEKRKRGRPRKNPAVAVAVVSVVESTMKRKEREAKERKQSLRSSSGKGVKERGGAGGGVEGGFKELKI